MDRFKKIGTLIEQKMLLASENSLSVTSCVVNSIIHVRGLPKDALSNDTKIIATRHLIEHLLFFKRAKIFKNSIHTKYFFSNL